MSNVSIVSELLLMGQFAVEIAVLLYLAFQPVEDVPNCEDCDRVDPEDVPDEESVLEGMYERSINEGDD